MYRIEAQVL